WHAASQQRQQVVPVTAIPERRRERLELRVVDPLLVPSDLFGAADLQALPSLQRLDEMAGFEQRFVGTGVEPCVPPTQRFHVKHALFEVMAIDVADLQFPARRRLERFRDAPYLVLVEIEIRHRRVRLGLRPLFLDADGPALHIELNHAVALWVLHPVGEYRRTRGFFRCLPECGLQVVAVEDIVPEHQRAGLGADELLADEECLGDSLRLRLYLVAETHAPGTAIAEALFEAWRVIRRGNDEDVADIVEHQRAQGVIDHRLVVDRQQLLGYDLRHREEARAAAPGKDDALHASPRLA